MKLFTTVKATLTKFAPVVVTTAAEAPKLAEEEFETIVKSAFGTLQMVWFLVFVFFLLFVVVHRYSSSDS